MADLFLSYHRADRDAVLVVQRLLQARGVTTFLDQDNLVRGQPWPRALEEALRACRGVAVFLGRELGAWQKRELWFALDRQAAEENRQRVFPVVPVLLPGADPGSGFLFLNTWVDLRASLEAAAEVDALVTALTTEAAPAARAIRADGGICPYRSLYPFREEDAKFLCGRDEVVQRLHEKVGATRLAAVVGSSGCGKSSVVMAGLVPRLRRQRPPAVTWDVAAFTPGRAPLRRLARTLFAWLEPDLTPTSLAEQSEALGGRFERGEVRPVTFVEEGLRRSGADRLLLVVDQFEELFTESTAEARKPFAQTLIALLHECPVTPVLTLRADFFGFAIDLNRELSALIEGGNVTVGPLRRDELRKVIKEPADLVGLRFESDLLIDKLLDDVGDEPGNLPLLEYALTELWNGRADGKLREATYQGINGVAGAIAARADAELRKLGTTDEVRRVMTRLVRSSPTTSGLENTRRRAVLADLGEAARPVVTQFSRPEVRLLVTSRDEVGRETVEVAHEALIGAWGQLKEWLAQDLELRLWRQRLEPSLEWWEKDRTNVLGGLALAEAEKWLHQCRSDLLDKETDFISASIAKRDADVAEEARQHEHELEMARRLAEESEARARAEEAARREAERRALTEAEKKRRIRVLAAVLGVLFLMAAGTAWWAYDAQHRAKKALDQVIQGLRTQLGSADAKLVVTAMGQLLTIHGRTPEDVVEWVPNNAAKQHNWFALVALELDERARLEGSAGGNHQWASETRRLLPAGVSRAKGVGLPPSPQEDEKLNRRIAIKAGSFMMGSPAGQGQEGVPEHREALSAFCIQEHEVTNKEYRRFDPSHEADVADDLPVVNVSWYDAMAYASWLGGSLPTEAQWEFAARGTEGRKYPWGPAQPTCNRAQFSRCGGQARSVKELREDGRTPEGVYDLAGNVMEWCLDESVNRLGQRAVRGASFSDDLSELYAANWGTWKPDTREDNIGFRVAWMSTEKSRSQVGGPSPP